MLRLRTFLCLLFGSCVVQSQEFSPDLLSCDFDENWNSSATICSYIKINRFFCEDSSTCRESIKIDGPLQGPTNHSGHYLRSAIEDRTIGILRHQHEINFTGEYCLQFDYHVFGNNFEQPSELDIVAQYLNRNNETRNIWLFHRSGNQSITDEWQHFKQTVYLVGHYRIIMEFRKYVGLDNFSFEEGPCSEVGQKMDCDFDVPFLSTDDQLIGSTWLTINPLNVFGSEDYLVWSRKSEHGDQTTKSKNGFYIEGRRENGQPNKFGEFIVKQITPEDRRQCLSFWYRSNQQINYLTIVERAVESGHENVLVEKTIGIDHRWIHQQVNIDPIVPLNLFIRVNNSGNIDFDSFRLRNGSCPGVGSCRFDKDICGFVQEPSVANLDTKKIRGYVGRGRVKEPSYYYEKELSLKLAYRAPEEKFFYFDYQKSIDKSNFKFVSEPISAGTYCLMLEYFGVRITLLSIGTIPGGPRTIYYRLSFSDFANHGWTVNRVDFKVQEETLVVFLVIPYNSDSSFEIKEIKLQDGACRNDTRPTSSRNFAEVSFHCYQTGHYIPQYRSCDGVIDCPMGEDEGDHCASLKCDMEGIPCAVRGHRLCLTDTHRLCNQIKDCDDGIDEDPRFCSEELFCANNCLNGTCHQGGDLYGCKCEVGFIGKRCQIE